MTRPSNTSASHDGSAVKRYRVRCGTGCRVARGSRCGDAGFTLIELLVVISIITLLIAILLPVLARAKEQAVKIQCMSNLRSVGLAINFYATDNKGVLLSGFGNTPSNYYDWNFLSNDPINRGWSPWLQLRDLDYLQTKKTFQCPASDSTVYPRSDNFTFSYAVGVGSQYTGWPSVAANNYLGKPGGTQVYIDDARIQKAVILSDNMYAVGSIGYIIKRYAHNVSSGIPTGGNSLFSDNHVVWRKVDQYVTVNAYSGVSLVKGL